jgi:hypothetical protein
MASPTKKTTLIRKNKKANQGKVRKTKNKNQGTTPTNAKLFGDKE